MEVIGVLECRSLNNDHAFELSLRYPASGLYKESGTIVLAIILLSTLRWYGLCLLVRGVRTRTLKL